MAYDVFISYAHEDRVLRDKLETHLSVLQNQGLINLWYDGHIIAGTEWEKQIMHHLRTDKIILLLISADFMASKFCYSIELKEAIERHEANDARVIPIILRPTYWKGAPFAKLQNTAHRWQGNYTLVPTRLRIRQCDRGHPKSHRRTPASVPVTSSGKTVTGSGGLFPQVGSLKRILYNKRPKIRKNTFGSIVIWMNYAIGKNVLSSLKRA